MKNDLTQYQLKEILRYDPKTGLFVWLINPSPKVKIGDMAGSVTAHGYVQVGINGFKYTAHRLAWLYVYGKFPPHQTDHVNHTKTDNRIENLRAVTNQENQQNKLLQANNTSGKVGVGWHKGTKRWRAYIKIGQKTISLGYYLEFKAAVKSRLEAEEANNFHENHGKVLAQC